MTTTTAATSPLNNTRHPAADDLTADPVRDLLIHDIRTPLAAISGYAQLLLRRTVTGNPDLAGLGDGLRRIEEAATRVGHLLDELTGVAPFAGADGTDHQRGMIDLVALVKHIAEESETAARDRARVVDLTAVPDVMGRWNSARLQSVLANLIDNALKYNRNDRAVVVNIETVDDWVVISVADRGVGIPHGELAHVFEPGYRATNVISHFSGSGLGLAGAHQIVAEHRGTISLESQQGSGTIVTVRLPFGESTS